MSDQEKFEELTQSIGQKLWSIMPEGADEIYFEAALYEMHSQRGAHWRNRDGSPGHFDWGKAPGDMDEMIANDLLKMKSLDIFEREPWDHVTVTLTEAGKISFQYAYVPDEDFWSGVIMRGVSDLNDEELEQAYVPMDIWEYKIEKAIPRKEQDALKAEHIGNLDRASKLRTEAESLRTRLAAYRASLS